MNFSDKIRTLRKEQGISQEELANRLDVSRQAISKWENGQGFPEMDTLLRMSTLFDASLDYLLKDGDGSAKETREESAYYVSAETAKKYLATKKKRGGQMALGVAVLIVSLSFTMFFSRPLGTVLFFLGAALGIAILVMLGFQPTFKGYHEMEERSLTIESTFLQALQKKYAFKQRKYGFIIVSGIVLFILSLVASVIIYEFAGSEMRYIAMLPLFWGVAAALIIFGATAMGAANIMINNREHVAELKIEKKRDWIYAVFMPLTAMVFLGIGFIWNAWHPGWLVFPVVGLLCYAYTAWGGSKE